MNNQDSKSSKNSKKPSSKSPERQPGESTAPIPPPLSTPQKPPSEESSKIYMTEPLDTARVASGERGSSENQGKKEEGEKEKTEQTSGTKGPDKVEGFYTYATSNKLQIITYILLALGLLLLLFFNSLLGEIMIGMVAGFHFASDIVSYIRNFGQMMRDPNQLRHIVFAAVLLGLFIAAPGIFIGAILVAIFKQVMTGSQRA